MKPAPSSREMCNRIPWRLLLAKLVVFGLPVALVIVLVIAVEIVTK